MNAPTAQETTAGRAPGLAVAAVRSAWGGWDGFDGMNQQLVGLLLAGWAAAVPGLWIGGLPAGVDALARKLTLAVLAALVAWLRRAGRELGGHLERPRQGHRQALRPGRPRAGLPAERLARLEGLAAARRDQAGDN